MPKRNLGGAAYAWRMAAGPGGTGNFTRRALRTTFFLDQPMKQARPACEQVDGPGPDHDQVADLPPWISFTAGDRGVGNARACRGPRTRRRRDLDRHHSRGHARTRHRGGARVGRNRGPAAGRSHLSKAGTGDRDRCRRARWRPCRGQGRAHDGYRSGPCRARGRAGSAQPARKPFGSGDRHARIRPPRRRHAHAHLLHAQDHAGAARIAEICSALRRRFQSPLRPR